MHGDVLTWVEHCLDVTGQPKRVAELGSRNVNGSVRHLFTGQDRYVGVDIRDGPGVDVVANAAHWETDDLFDAVVACEILEHTPDAEAICRNAYRLLVLGGACIITTAWTCRDPHSGIDGHLLGDQWTDDPTDRSGREYYRNISEADLLRWLSDFQEVDLSTTGCDIRALARKT